jgi:hypothetical protein
MPLIRDVRMTGRLVRDLGPFLDRVAGPEECRRALAARAAARDESFLRLMRQAVFGHAVSPYRPLLERADLSFADVERMVARTGVEGALETLYDAGVRLTLDEVKSRKPVLRGSRSLTLSPTSCDNPLVRPAFALRTSGSTGLPRRVAGGLDLVEHDAWYDGVYLHAIGAIGRPVALWRPVPPGSAGLKGLLRFTHLGMTPERWFSQVPTTFTADLGHAIFTRLLLAAARWYGRRLPAPEHVPPSRADIVARWLAGCVRRGLPGLLDTTGSSALRVIRSARESGLDVTGSIVRVGGEPLTAARAAIFTEAGVRPVAHYAMSEVGRIGTACPHPDAVDEVHVAREKVAVVRRPADASCDGPALFLTTIATGSPKVFVNVEIGDTGVVTARSCQPGAPAVDHLHTIRSYEKLTTEGMHFAGVEILRLVEQVLPARFGGGPTDYQLVDRTDGAVRRVEIVVRPSLGDMRDEDVSHAVLAALGAGGPAQRMMATLWQSADAVRVVRREPAMTRTGKVPALHSPVCRTDA